MTGHHQISSKIKLRLFTACFNRVNDKAKFLLLKWKKNLIVLPSLWSDDMDIETLENFQNIHLVLTKKVVHFDQLRQWQKTDVNRRLLMDSFYRITKLPINNLLGDFKIELILSF